MRILMTLLLVGAVSALASAVTGVQSVYSDSRTGTVITYWHGYGGRLLAVGYAAILALAFYGIYRRYPSIWKLGFVALCLSAADFIFNAWQMLLPQPEGWVGAAAATVFVPLVALYWGRWWQRQKSYFFPNADEQT
jgi:hypothetical protein